MIHINENNEYDDTNYLFNLFKNFPKINDRIVYDSDDLNNEYNGKTGIFLDFLEDGRAYISLNYVKDGLAKNVRLKTSLKNIKKI